MALTSGETAVSTSSDTAVQLIAATRNMLANLTVINEGGAAGFISIDGGTTFPYRLPAGPSSRSIQFSNAIRNLGIYVKRVSGGADLSGIYGDAEIY